MLPRTAELRKDLSDALSVVKSDLLIVPRAQLVTMLEALDLLSGFVAEHPCTCLLSEKCYRCRCLGVE